MRNFRSRSTKMAPTLDAIRGHRDCTMRNHDGKQTSAAHVQVVDSNPADALASVVGILDERVDLLARWRPQANHAAGALPLVPEMGRKG